VSALRRTYDVSAFRGQAVMGDRLLSQSIFGPDNRGEVITGSLKVAQWFIVEFMTVRGSVAYDKTRGTNFISSLISGRIRTETDAFVAFGFAVGQIAVAAILNEPATAPDDERFAGAALTHAVVQPGVLKLYVTLTTKAGTARPLILPVATSV
jgi:hypothetical protein